MKSQHRETLRRAVQYHQEAAASLRRRLSVGAIPEAGALPAPTMEIMEAQIVTHDDLFEALKDVLAEA